MKLLCRSEGPRLGCYRASVHSFTGYIYGGAILPLRGKGVVVVGVEVVMGRGGGSTERVRSGRQERGKGRSRGEGVGEGNRVCRQGQGAGRT